MQARVAVEVEVEEDEAVAVEEVERRKSLRKEAVTSAVSPLLSRRRRLPFTMTTAAAASTKGRRVSSS